MYRSACHCDCRLVNVCYIELSLISHGTEPQVNWLNVRRTRSCFAWGSSLPGQFKFLTIVPLPYVFACYGFQSKIHGLVTYKRGIYWLTVLEAGSPRSRCWQVWFLPRPLPGLQMAVFLPCAHVAFSLCIPGVSLCVQISFCKNIRQTGLGPTNMTHLTFFFLDSFNLNYLFKALSPNTVTIWCTRT